MQTSHIKLCLVLLLQVTSLFQAGANNHIHPHNKNREITMYSIDGNKEVVRKVYEQALNKKNMGLLKELISDDYTGIGGSKGATAFETPVIGLIRAFPDIQWTIEELIGEGDKVFIRWKWRGTHTAPFQQYIATGKLVTNDGMAVFQLKDGRIISAQILTDRLGFLQQVEALPADLSLLSNKKN